MSWSPRSSTWCSTGDEPWQDEPMEELSVTAKVIRPFWGRVALIASPVDEYERQSGLIVPDRYDGDTGIFRGVVIAVDNPQDAGPHHDALSTLDVGAVVWYVNGYEVRDTVIVDPQDIIAVEVDA